MTYNEEAALIRHLFIKGQPQTFGKGDVIIGNEPEPNGVYFIESGYIKAYSISDDGDEYLHLIYGHGEIFPIIWAYLGLAPDAVYYEAMADTVTWRMSRDWFLRFALVNPRLSAALSNQLARQYQIFTERVDNLEYKKAGQRVAYRLLFLASRFGVRTNRGIVIDAPLTHETFANSINLARETVSRQLESLEKEEIIKAASQHIVILDIHRLITKLSRPSNIKNWRLA